jgi:chalcone isomerase-like protein
MRLPLAGPAVILAVAFAVSPGAEEVTEPRTGVGFPVKAGDLTLLGVGARTKTFLKVKVYAAAFYVADSAIAGPLAAHRGQPVTPALYRDLVWGDFPKLMVLHFVRDVTTAQIQRSLREALAKADPTRREAFIAYFGDTRAGEEYRIRWAPGGILETTAAGKVKPPIPDKNFAAAAFGAWLGDEAVQQDLRRALVSRAPVVLR